MHKKVKEDVNTKQKVHLLEHQYSPRVDTLWPMSRCPFWEINVAEQDTTCGCLHATQERRMVGTQTLHGPLQRKCADSCFRVHMVWHILILNFEF